MSLCVCIYMHPAHGYLKVDDSDSELEDLKEFLGLETPADDTPRLQCSRDSAGHIGRDTFYVR